VCLLKTRLQADGLLGPAGPQTTLLRSVTYELLDRLLIWMPVGSIRLLDNQLRNGSQLDKHTGRDCLPYMGALAVDKVAGRQFLEQLRLLLLCLSNP
jgi:hypothetical protein